VSLASLASAEIDRVEAHVLTERSVRNLVIRASQIAPQHSNAFREVDGALAEAAKAPAAKESSTATTNALEALVKYVPTESVTLYVAAASAGEALAATMSFFTPLFSYWFFAGLTPVLFLLIFAGKRRAQDLPPFPPLAQWPWWKLAASFVAFLSWGLAIPNHPYAVGSPLRGAAFAFAAVFVSTFLSILEGVIEPKRAR
jgi:hypothetical protein